MADTKEYTLEVSIDYDGRETSPDRVIPVNVQSPTPELSLDLYKTAAIQAAKSLAASLVDYASFSSDSVYLTELDCRRKDMTITAVTLAGAPVSHLCLGIYPEYPEGGTWCDTVEASTNADAQFQAKWQMAVNCLGEDGYPDGTDEGVAEFFDEVEVQDIVYCHTALPADPRRLALIKAEPLTPIRLLPVETVSGDATTAAMIAEAKSLGVGFVAIPA